MIKKRIFKKLIVALCIVFLFVYISSSFLSYGHDCNGQECTVCLLIGSIRSLFNILSLNGVLYHILLKGFGLKDVLNNIRVSFDSSLVVWRVKLSN